MIIKFLVKPSLVKAQPTVLYHTILIYRDI